MKNYVKGRQAECSTQAELDAAIKAEAFPIYCVGAGWFEAWGSSHVVARGSSHVVARGSSHVVARGSSHVEARGSSHVVARESSHVEAWESSHVVASQWTAIHKMLGHTGKIKGGVVIAQPKLKTAKDWCAYHGVTVTRGVAILYKGVNDDFTSPRGTSYAPGTKPEAADWDGGKTECGGGLHFSPSPAATLEFHSAAKRFLACPVRLTDIRAPKIDDEYPQKVKARGLCGPAVEVDRMGEPIKSKKEAA